MNASQTSVLLWLSHQPEGARVPEVARAVAISDDAARRILAALRRHGHAEFCGLPCSSFARYCVPQHLAATSARVEALQIESKRNIRRRQQESKLRRIAEGRESETDKPFVHRTVPATEARPIPKRGPASVWELA